MHKFGIDTAQVKPNSRIPGCSTSIEVPAVKKSTTGRQFTIFQYSVFNGHPPTKGAGIHISTYLFSWNTYVSPFEC